MCIINNVGNIYLLFISKYTSKGSRYFMTSLIYELVQVQSVPTKSREFYKLSIKNNNTGKIEDIILHNPNIRKYCKQNNISLVKYEDQYNYNDIKTEDYIDLIGVIDKYITEDLYQYKRLSID